jgi:type IV pilus biogenesis protein PilP
MALTLGCLPLALSAQEPGRDPARDAGREPARESVRESVRESAAESLTRIEAETMVLLAREKQLDVQAKIMARQSEIANRQSENDKQARGPVVGNPTVHSIEGIGNHMVATLVTDNGSLMEAKVGDVLANGMKVASIRSGEVIVLDRNKTRVRLSATSVQSASFNAAFPAVGMNLQGFPANSTMLVAPR